jgi:hypothetical protein
MMALAREPWNRYPRAKDFADALEPLAAGESKEVGLKIPTISVVSLAESA